jgi:uncharacterized protein YecT (DUF1311 family)
MVADKARQTNEGGNMLLAALAVLLVQSDKIKPDCNGSTPEIATCMEEKLDRAEKRLQTYLQAAIEKNTDDSGNAGSVVLGINASQAAFESYRKIECYTVYEDYKEGTIRGIMNLGCQLNLTNERTHVVWANWLQYMDSTPPKLPEPKPIK